MELLFDPKPGMIIWSALAFLAMLLILGKFGFKPMLGALEKREKDIEEAMRKAEEARKAAASIGQMQEQKMKEAAAEGAKVVNQAQQAANRLREEAVTEARNEGARIIEQARTQIEIETDKAMSKIQERIVDLALEASRKIMNRELAEQDQRRLVREFIEDLERINGQAS